MRGHRVFSGNPLLDATHSYEVCVGSASTQLFESDRQRGLVAEVADPEQSPEGDSRRSTTAFGGRDHRGGLTLTA